jgi:hypothetical protein
MINRNVNGTAEEHDRVKVLTSRQKEILVRACLRHKHTFAVVRGKVGHILQQSLRDEADRWLGFVWAALMQLTANTLELPTEELLIAQIESLTAPTSALHDEWDAIDSDTLNHFLDRTYHGVTTKELKRERSRVKNYVDRICNEHEHNELRRQLNEDDEDGRVCNIGELAADIGKRVAHNRTYERPTLREFIARAGRLTYLIEDMLCSGQPLVIGGKSKTLKTSLLVDAAVSLASATPMLGRFKVPTAKKTMLLSGESGDSALVETLHRVRKARGVKMSDIEDTLILDSHLPRLTDASGLATVEADMQNGVKVLMLDPLYLCMPGDSAGNVFVQGERLRQISDITGKYGCTLILCHHVRKGIFARDNSAAPELDDLAFAGFGEWARQWWLVGRREKFQPGTGRHSLWLNVGGSGGHSAEFALTINEGHPRSRWEVKIESAARMREAEDRLKKRRKKDERLRAASIEIQTELSDQLRKKSPQTMAQLAKATGHSRDGAGFRDAIAKLEAAKVVIVVEMRGDNGKTLSGYTLSPAGQRKAIIKVKKPR